jgi:putative addiction module killer protein
LSKHVEETEVYRDWINGLKDLAARARIQVRVDRLVHGNPGTHRHLTDGVSELKIDVGPGYRVYYTKRGTRLLLLLAGGNKSTQRRDIASAIRLAQNYEE